MSMTKMHFESLATSINAARLDALDMVQSDNPATRMTLQAVAVSSVALVASRVADSCAATNSAFNRERFFSACGLEHEASQYEKELKELESK